jgi:hypothetical protein
MADGSHPTSTARPYTFMVVSMEACRIAGRHTDVAQAEEIIQSVGSEILLPKTTTAARAI